MLCLQVVFCDLQLEAFFFSISVLETVLNEHKYGKLNYPRMQPSMGTLNSPSSRVVKDSTPPRHRILRYINVGIGASSPVLFLDMVNQPNNI